MKQCLVVEDSRLARIELVDMLEKIGSFEHILIASNATEARKFIMEEVLDVVFMDIHLPGENAFDLLESLDFLPKIIFTTAYDQYAIKSFDFNAIDYLLKPISEKKLVGAIEKLPKQKVTKAKKVSGLNQIFVKDGERCWFVKLEEIRLIESKGNYSRIYFRSDKPLLQKSLNYLEQHLDESVFIRVNRQQIINLNYIDNITPWFKGKLKIKLITGEEIEVSRRQSQRIKSLFTI